MNVLIIKLSAIGDVILAGPFLAALRRAWPQARISWLVEEAAADLVLDHPLLDRVIVSSRKSWIKDLKAGRIGPAWSSLKRFLKDLRAERYDLVIDLQGLFKSGILAALSGGRRRLGFEKTRELSWLFVNERLPAYDPDRHALDRYLDVARHLGAEPVPGWAWPENPAAGKNAEVLLDPAAGSGRRRVAVNPGAKWPTKLWPKDAWIDLVRRLDIEGFQVVVTGGPDERDHNRALAEAAPGILDLTGRTGLKVLAEVYRRVDLLVSPDTGPMHLCAAVGTPVAALFGPTSAQRTGPFGPDHTVISLNVDCRPCFLKNCPDPRCMTDITPQAVMAAVRNRMER